MSPILPNPATGKSRQLLVLFFLVLFFFLFSRLLGQNPDGKFDEGVLYFKVLDNAGIQPSLTSPHDLGLLVPEYKIISIRKAFKTPHVSLQSIYKLTFTEHERANELISDLEKLNYIEYAERAPLYEVDYIPNDYSASQQWSLEKIDATDAWNITTGSSSIVIAIVDNGVNYSHEDLLSNVWVNPGEIPANNFDDD
ncbi:MAG TPA: hypothetical protein VI731_04885, partial [Bacteroidia bacterium]|nr:hypothetical protein [Bacteroidia bacterium]